MIDTKGLDEFRKAWDEAKESKEPKAADTGAVTNVDDFDYGDPVKDTAKADEIKAAPVVESKADDSDKSPVQTTPAVEPAKLSFKEAFAKEYKRYKADPSSASTFDWVGKDGKTTKIALKLKSEVGKNYAAQDKAMAGYVPRRNTDAEPKQTVMKQYNPEPAKVPVLTDAAPAVQMVTDALPAKAAKPANKEAERQAEYSAGWEEKAADSHKAITDKMGVDSKTLLPKPETRIAAAGKGNRVQ